MTISKGELVYEAISLLPASVFEEAEAVSVPSPNGAAKKRRLFQTRGFRAAMAACIAVVLIAGFLIGGSFLGWFPTVEAGKPAELEIGWLVAKYNTVLPEGYEVHLQEEYLNEGYVPDDTRIDIQSPDCPPIPEIQIVNSEGKRVMQINIGPKSWITNALKLLGTYHWEDGNVPITIHEKGASDQNGNRYLLYEQYYPKRPYYNDSEAVETIFHFVVDLTGSKYYAIRIDAFGSEEEARMLYEALNLRFIKDREMSEEEAAFYEADWNGDWYADWKYPDPVADEIALYDGN